MPGSIGAAPGWATTSTPRKPMSAAIPAARQRSPNRKGASSATQIGLVNSSATSWLSGIA